MGAHLTVTHVDHPIRPKRRRPGSGATFRPLERKEAGRPHNTSTPLGKILAALNVPLYQFSAEVRISARTITNYLNGTRVPPPTIQVRIARALGVSPATLWPRDHPSQRPPGTGGTATQ